MALKVCLTSLEYKDAAVLHELYKTNTHTHTQSFNSRFTDYPGRPVPEETFTHSHPS